MHCAICDFNFFTEQCGYLYRLFRCNDNCLQLTDNSAQGKVKPVHWKALACLFNKLVKLL